MALTRKRKHKKKRKKQSCAIPKKRHGKKLTAKQKAAAKRKLPKHCRPKKKAKKKPGVVTPVKPAPSHQVAPPAGSPPPPPPPPPLPPPPPPTPGITSPIAMYTGPFGVEQATRLLWRAGFGPRPGDAARVAALGLEKAVMSLTRPVGAPVLEGPEPLDRNGKPLSPLDVREDDHLYWMDRMLRSSHQLVERMSLVFHDWFATSRTYGIQQRLMLEQTNLFRAEGLGSFREMVRGITNDGATIFWLSQHRNSVRNINENYARELMELFTLGADRGAYTEQDVREAAKALSGFWYDDSAIGPVNFRFWPQRHEPGDKTIFGRTGPFDWEDVCAMVIDHPLHASFFVTKLWSYFVPTPPSTAERQALEKLYVSTGQEIRPVLEAILTSKALFTGSRMVKPPVVFATGLLRATRRFIDRGGWDSTCADCGQRLYFPPDVSGWDDTRWLDTNTMRGRWGAIYNLMRLDGIQGGGVTNYDPNETPEEAIAAATRYWGASLSPASRTVLLDFARSANPVGSDARTRAERQNVLRQIIAAGPDYQTS